MSLESEYVIVIRWALRAGDVKRAKEAVAWARKQHGLDMRYVFDEQEFSSVSESEPGPVGGNVAKSA